MDVDLQKSIIKGELLDSHQWHSTNVHEFSMIDIGIRHDYNRYVGFPIITKEIVDTLVEILQNKKTLEVGCGTGFLCKKLLDRGIDIIGVDNDPEKYGFKKRYIKSINKDAVTCIEEKYDTILMSWPDYANEFAYSIAKAMYPGQMLIYEGEDDCGCTADADFFKIISEEFTQDHLLSNKLNKDLIQFFGIHDYWCVYIKK
jgi:SAM-dependent methyltransferase